MLFPAISCSCRVGVLQLTLEQTNHGDNYRNTSQNSRRIFKAVIKKHGKIFTTKRWSTRKAAVAWARRIENDNEMLEALDSGMATMTFAMLSKEYIEVVYFDSNETLGLYDLSPIDELAY